MADQITVRFVTTTDDANAEMHAAAEATDYQMTAAQPIELTPDGSPVDATLADSLPGQRLVEARFVDPVTIGATITLATLAVRLVNHWMKSREAGVQIDTRTTPATISRIAGVPFGTLSIIHPDGRTTLHREAYDAPEDVMGTLAETFAGA